MNLYLHLVLSLSNLLEAVRIHVFCLFGEILSKYYLRHCFYQFCSHLLLELSVYMNVAHIFLTFFFIFFFFHTVFHSGLSFCPIFQLIPFLQLYLVRFDSCQQEILNLVTFIFSSNTSLWSFCFYNSMTMPKVSMPVLSLNMFLFLF